MTKDTWYGALIFFGAIFTGVLIGIQFEKMQQEKPVPTELVEVEIVSVLNESPFTPKTLIEFEDGTRQVFSNYYGEEGDTFFMEVEVDG